MNRCIWLSVIISGLWVIYIAHDTPSAKTFPVTVLPTPTVNITVIKEPTYIEYHVDCTYKNGQITSTNHLLMDGIVLNNNYMNTEWVRLNICQSPTPLGGTLLQ